MPEFLELRYDRRSRYAFSGCTVLTGMLIDSAGAMFAGALVLQLLSPLMSRLDSVLSLATEAPDREAIREVVFDRGTWRCSW